LLKNIFNCVQEQTVPNETEYLEQSLKILDEKLATALSESNSKDEQLIKAAEMEQEAIAGNNFVSSFFQYCSCTFFSVYVLSVSLKLKVQF